MRKGIGNSIKGAAVLALLCLFFLSLAGCARSSQEKTVYCADIEHTPYPATLAQLLPSYAIERAAPHVFSYLAKGAAAEAFDVQAASALEIGVAGYWYPQYLATVVIAVDRGQTDARIESWSDLPAAGVTVGYNDASGSEEMLTAAIAYGLEGDAFSLDQAVDLLAALHAKGCLVRNTFDTPIAICYDYQAAALIKGGRHIEIVVPSEGTLAYTKGLLSNTAMPLADDADAVLLAAGLRLPGGQCDDALYPGAAAYKNAGTVDDYAHFNAVCQNSTRVLRRSIFHTRIYSSTDQREHQYFVMLYASLVIIWTASFIRRAMQKGVRRAALLTGNMLLGWILVRLIKYQLIEADIVNRLLWYAFYLFQLALPLVLLWLAWAIDKQDAQVGFPKWLRVLSAINAALVVLVFTNDVHGFVFRLDLSSPNWSRQYSYGPGYYIVLVACALPLLAALVMLVAKSGRNPRKKKLCFSAGFLCAADSLRLRICHAHPHCVGQRFYDGGGAVHPAFCRGVLPHPPDTRKHKIRRTVYALSAKHADF